ncbi:glycosyltransferase [Robertkochia sediminum]|uniref:glycosyltransferase n=1 Tax=Robertkochia sediminum TaxID=2785326 RepID=UPI0019326205|nr:glycosyltransferase [Robertkochia sediminum]MBL7471756.1 glycosyltransferase [Robertkochia sediminum]
MRKLVILQTTIPDYREKIFLYLREELGENFILFGGDNYFESSVKTNYGLPFMCFVRNRFFLKRRFLFQTGMWGAILGNNVWVMEMNPRIISNWLILLIRKAAGKKTVLWGHAWPRAGKGSKSDRLRHFMRSLADEIIVYTHSQRRELHELMPHKAIVAAPNSVFFKDEMCLINGDQVSKRKNFIYVGRLTLYKKPMLLVRAFKCLCAKDQAMDVNLLIVGAGEEYEKIRQYIEENNLIDRVKLFGHVGDYEELKDLYSTAIASVSPGYVGLSITQSFGFGVPMIISKRENHSPEIEAAVDGFNSLFFNTDDMENLAEKMEGVIANRNSWISRSEEIIDFAKERYSVEAMGSAFLELL